MCLDKKYGWKFKQWKKSEQQKTSNAIALKEKNWISLISKEKNIILIKKCEKLNKKIIFKIAKIKKFQFCIELNLKLRIFYIL